MIEVNLDILNYTVIDAGNAAYYIACYSFVDIDDNLIRRAVLTNRAVIVCGYRAARNIFLRADVGIYRNI